MDCVALGLFRFRHQNYLAAAFGCRISWWRVVDQRGTMTISLKDFRESAGLRQEDVAQAVGVHQSSVSKAERGKATPMVAIKISAWTNGLVPSWTMAKGAVGG